MFPLVPRAEVSSPGRSTTRPSTSPAVRSCRDVSVVESYAFVSRTGRTCDVHSDGKTIPDRRGLSWTRRCGCRVDGLDDGGTECTCRGG